MKPIATKVLAALAAYLISTAGAQTLDIYFIDVEGGQSTLIVTPEKETLLVDTGFAGNGTSGVAGDPHQSRDARRIEAAARDAGVDHIDALLITHFHADHVGGVVELAQLLPIHTFIDHGSLIGGADVHAQMDLNVFNAYMPVRAKGRHIEPQPGDRLPLKGVEAIVVSSAGATIKQPLAGAGGANPACNSPPLPPGDVHENPRSTGFRLTYGKFKFLDIGDLSGDPLAALACPNNLVGPVDVYLVAHHGAADVADAATFAAFQPRVAIVNNGARKGGMRELFKRLHMVKGLEDVWQLHRSLIAGPENYPDERIANLDESSAHWLKLSAKADGSFRILNARTGQWTSYPAPTASTQRGGG